MTQSYDRIIKEISMVLPLGMSINIDNNKPKSFVYYKVECKGHILGWIIFDSERVIIDWGRNSGKKLEKFLLADPNFDIKDIIIAFMRLAISGMYAEWEEVNSKRLEHDFFRATGKILKYGVILGIIFVFTGIGLSWWFGVGPWNPERIKQQAEIEAKANLEKERQAEAIKEMFMATFKEMYKEMSNSNKK